MPKIVVFSGPAGAGKSSLVASYGYWLRETQGLYVSLVNLDPAAEFVPYEPSYDIRLFVNTRDLMVKLGLGPNGALVRALEIIGEELNVHIDAILGLSSDYILIDTPGQMDVFLISGFGERLISKLREESKERVLVFFVVDASTMKRLEDYAFTLILAASLRGKLCSEVVPVVNKIDLIDEIIFTGDVRFDSSIILEYLGKAKSLYSELLGELLEVASRYVKSARVPLVSAKRMLGMEELHRVTHEFLCACGDLT